VRFTASVIPSCPLSHNTAGSGPRLRVHLPPVISSEHAMRMKIRLWKRCRRRRKTRKVCSIYLSLTSSQYNAYRRPPALSFWQPSTPSQRERVRRLSLSSLSPTPRRSARLHTPPPTKRPRRSAGPVSGPVSAPLQVTSRYKRGCRGELPALNAEFEIDPTTNTGVRFAFDEVVRGRRHRHGLNAGECEECHGVGAYLHVNALILIFASLR